MGRSDPRPWPAGRWRRLLADAVSDVDALLTLLDLDGATVAASTTGPAGRFPVRVPRGFARRMRRGDPTDPLLRQVLASADENREVAGFGPDPVAEGRLAAASGLITKYRGRALLVATGACAIHCRYCFRRHFPYGEASGVGDRWRRAVAEIAADPILTEVILSGGDPLTVPDSRLSELVTALAAVPHLRRLRLHTRLPVVLPERVDEALVGWLAPLPLQKVVVLHANHPAELDGDVARAAGVLADAGCVLLNQSVLLAGVNDDAAILAALSEGLFGIGVLPYYLHLLDPVAGAAHFAVDEVRARRLVGEVAARLSGYLVPRLVREVPGMPAKVAVAPLLADS